MPKGIKANKAKPNHFFNSPSVENPKENTKPFLHKDSEQLKKHDEKYDYNSGNKELGLTLTTLESIAKKQG